MQTDSQDSEDLSGAREWSERSFSLALALRRVVRRAGGELDLDDLHAAMGLSWMMVAVAHERDLGNWLLYARDAFLVRAGQLFGLNLRPLHPPEAAVGLRGAAEFQQHFDASYRPLILRALQDSQPVLAWGDWSMPGSPQRLELLWGVIEESGDDGLNLRGVVLPPSNLPDGASLMTLGGPPVQLYIAESVTPQQPDPDELLCVALDHARRTLDNTLEDRFKVVTGPAAYDAWLARLAERTNGDAGDFHRSHCRLATSVIAAHESGIRFLERCRRMPNGPELGLEALASECRTIVTALRESLGGDNARGFQPTPHEQAKVTDALSRAQEATRGMRTALNRKTAG